MSTMSRDNARLLLGSLLGLDPVTETGLHGEPLLPVVRVPKPKWELIGITLQYQTRRCDCGMVHTSLNPLVLAHELKKDPSGNVIADNKTSNIHALNVPLDGVEWDRLPVENEYLEGAPMLFCLDCIPTLDPHALLLLQKKQLLRTEAHEELKAIERSIAKRTKAEEALLKLANEFDKVGDV